MPQIKPSVLFGKINSLGYKSLESATVFCKLRGNPTVELVHWFQQSLQITDSDIHRVLRHFGVDNSLLAAHLSEALDRLPHGHTSLSGFSQGVREMAEQGWLHCTLLYNQRKVRTGHLMVALALTSHLEAELHRLSREFRKIKGDELAENLDSILKGSPEEVESESLADGVQPGESSDALAPAEMGKQQALKQFSVDLTEKARNGEIDPIFGRDEEVRQIVDVLMRRRQNNPILTGEAGVGKTAIAEGFALRIASGDVPPALRGVTLRTLDLGLLQAGASMKGEFENRLKKVIEEVQASTTPVILFIDEAHTLIGAGGAAGQGDAANLLKPALARGTLRTIAATTLPEYRKYFEKDPALTRRFQVIKVEEPDEAKAVLMVRGISPLLEKHHQVQVLGESIRAAVRMSHRYIPDRLLPDKAISLLDTACARVSISQHASPARVEDNQRVIEALRIELSILDREALSGRENTDEQNSAREKLAAAEILRAELDAHWQQEKTLVTDILALREKLRQTPAEPPAPADEPAPAPAKAELPPLPEDPRERKKEELRRQLAALEETAEEPETSTPAAAPDTRESLLVTLRAKETELAALQGDAPLVLPCVDEMAVAQIVAELTGIPVGRMVRDEIQAILRLADTLEKRVIGQRHALDAIAKRLQTTRAGLENPVKPIGVFLLVGPSGVGKTETALTLAETLYGDESSLISINMSEYQEAHTVSTLKGAPPGYVGYGEGGVLTEAVRRRPYSVVLLDEVEKAHADVHEIFFQVFDKGRMEDSEGRLIDFRNTVIILTSNVGSDLIANLCKDPEMAPSPDGLATALRPPLLKVFPAALLGRLTVIPYLPLSDAMLRDIIRLQLERVRKRILENQGVELILHPAVTDLIASRCTEHESGGRMVDAILTHTLLPEISREILTRLAEGATIARIEVTVQDDTLSYVFA